MIKSILFISILALGSCSEKNDLNVSYVEHNCLEEREYRNSLDMVNRELSNPVLADSSFHKELEFARAFVKDSLNSRVECFQYNHNVWDSTMHVIELFDKSQVINKYSELGDSIYYRLNHIVDIVFDANRDFVQSYHVHDTEDELGLSEFWGVYSSDDCTVPEQIEEMIYMDLPGIKIVKESELMDKWLLYLKTDCPTIAKGNFNGDGKVDYAFLTTNDSEIEPYQLLVIQSVNSAYETIKLMDIGFGIYDGGLGFGIATYPIGRIEGISKNVTLKNEAILFTKFESSSQVIFFNGKNYEEIWIGD